MKCNCENLKCSNNGLHEPGKCQASAGKKKAIYVGALCDACASKMDQKYITVTETKICVTVREMRQMIAETLSLETVSTCEGDCKICEQPSEKCECNLYETQPPGHENQVKSIKKALKRGEIPQTFVDKAAGKRKKTNPWAISWSAHNSE
jgi:hypothetical protein